jgi:hypothetical protein
MGDIHDLEPRVELKQLSVDRNEKGKAWSIRWVVKNGSLQRLRIVTVRLPHEQFKAEEKRFDPPLDLAQEAEAEFYTLVGCEEPPGLVTENAFLIFYVIWHEEPWRIFVRIRVLADAEGKPHATTEWVTTQRVGFSQAELL